MNLHHAGSTLVALWCTLGFIACGGSPASSPTAPDPSHFTGAPWSGTSTTSASCAHSPPKAFAATFQVDGDAIGYVAGGCAFLLEVAAGGDAASLTNGPVQCTGVAVDGATVPVTYLTFDAVSTDGRSLSATVSGYWQPASGSSCGFTDTIAATR